MVLMLYTFFLKQQQQNEKNKLKETLLVTNDSNRFKINNFPYF